MGKRFCNRWSLVLVVGLVWAVNSRCNPENPAPNDPIVAGNAEVAFNGMILRETAGVTTDNYPVQFGRPFLAGEIPDFPQVYIDGTPVLTQADVKCRWEDGSVKHAVLSFLVPTLTAGSTLHLTFGNQPSGNNTDPLGTADMLGNLFDFDAIMEFSDGSDVVGASARSMVEAGAYTYWLQGAVCTSVIVADHSVDRVFDVGFDAYRSMRPIFHATFWPAIGKVRVRCITEICNTEALQDQTYDVTLKTGWSSPEVVFTQNGVLHTAGSRWTKEFWIGGTPSEIEINHNLEYLAATRFLPNYDLSVVVPESTINYWYSAGPMSWLGAQDRDLLFGKGNLDPTMGATGEHYELGPNPLWPTLWFYTWDNRMREQAFGNTALMLAWPVHTREGDPGRYLDRDMTVPGLGRVMSLSGRPTGADDPVPVGSVAPGPWKPMVTHCFDGFTALYTLTGDFWLLEESWFWAGWAAFGTTWYPSLYYGRGPLGHGGIGHVVQARGDARIFKLRVQAAFVSPDDAPEKDYFTTLVNDAIAIWEGQRDITGTPFEGDENWVWGNTTGKGKWSIEGGFGLGPPPLGTWESPNPVLASPQWEIDPTTCAAGASWQIRVMSYALGRARELGFSAGPLHAWAAHAIIGQLSSNGYSPHAAVSYVIPTVSKATGQWYQTWEEAATGYLPSYDPVAYFAMLYSWQGSSHVNHLRRAVAMMTDLPGGQAAWEWVQANAMPSQTNDPRYAINPRE